MQSEKVKNIGKEISAERVLVIRLGAIGDCIGITPLIRYLSKEGKTVYVLTKETGRQIFMHNPYIEKIVMYNEELKTLYPTLEDVPNDKLSEFFKAVAQAYECEETINLCEVWEVKLARHPAEPNYKYPKDWAREHCDINYYEQVFKMSEIECKGMSSDFFRPKMFFTSDEEVCMHNFFVDFRKRVKMIVMWGLSGSAANKTYPYVPEVMYPLLDKYPWLGFLTVGDEVCRILETELKHERIFNRSGVWSIRQSCLATKYVDLVIAPDTGILHAAGMYNTPKIGLLTHTSRNNITKHFINDYSLTAEEGGHPFFKELSCSPCYKIIYNKRIQCNLTHVKDTKTPVCMAYGFPPEKVISRIEEVLNG